MRLLVTGSAGHLGEALMRTLPDAGHQAIGIDIKPSPFTHHVGSIVDRAFVSRCMHDVTMPAHRMLAQRAREVLATYRDAADLVEVGAYVAGSNPRVDRALRCIHEVNNFLKQGPDERFALEQTLAMMQRALEPAPIPEEGRHV